MANSRIPLSKFKVGDDVVIAYAKHAPGFFTGAAGRVKDRAVKERRGDKRPNRYDVVLEGQYPEVRAWFNEDDLCTYAEAREEGLIS